MTLLKYVMIYLAAAWLALSSAYFGLTLLEFCIIVMPAMVLYQVLILSCRKKNGKEN